MTPKITHLITALNYMHRQNKYQVKVYNHLIKDLVIAVQFDLITIRYSCIGHDNFITISPYAYLNGSY